MLLELDMVREKLPPNGKHPSKLLVASKYSTKQQAIFHQGDCIDFMQNMPDEVAQLEITLPTGAKAKVEVRDGTMATVQDEKTGYMYGFVIAIGTSSNQITVTSIAITDDGKHVTQFHGSDEDSITPGASLLITAKYTTAAKKELTLPFNLYLMDISPGQFPNVRPLRQPLKSLSPDQLKTIFGKVGGGSCCVSCYGITVCAGRVDLDCGSCGSGGGFLAN